MSNLSLRAYHQKIESWIEENKIDKALSQCVYILSQFPKNLHTFQALSKALLQKQDYENAEKAFDIILQIEPDDFVSHIGKSMIAEFNHSLDSAIEHMKYAFEIQPSNEGLQNEVKRLLLAKENIEPKKINLTRGALIKMYLKGELYDQAIAEAKIGISESPQRIDYRVALAKSFFESGDFIKAVETCVEIVSQLPYCLPANEIIDKVLSKNQANDKNGFYHQRLVELDPYYAFMLPSTKSVLDVPDIAVMLEDESEKDNFEFDLASVFSANWNKSDNHSENENLPSEDFDWDSIIESGLENSVMKIEIANGFDNSEIIDDDSNNTLQNIKMTNSRKKVFLDKLRFSKSPSDDQVEIPEWFFDDNGEVIQNTSESGINESEESAEVPTASFLTDEGFDFRTDDNGLFDIDVQPAVNDKEELEQSGAMWINDEETSNQTSSETLQAKLDDTQQIKLQQENIDDLLTNSEKALEGGNIVFAQNSLRKLIVENKNLREVSTQLEKAVELYPENSDFRLLLGHVYSILDEKEKALAILRNAQKLISL